MKRCSARMSISACAVWIDDIISSSTHDGPKPRMCRNLAIPDANGAAVSPARSTSRRVSSSSEHPPAPDGSHRPAPASCLYHDRRDRRHRRPQSRQAHAPSSFLAKVAYDHADACLYAPSRTGMSLASGSCHEPKYGFQCGHPSGTWHNYTRTASESSDPTRDSSTAWNRTRQP